MKWYVDRLEQMAIDTCKSLGINEARRSPHTGVWIDGNEKICAIGVRNAGFVTYHGLALNCSVDLVRECHGKKLKQKHQGFLLGLAVTP